jgi:prepilin-type N-terminal cleavage/methylation domain-containing protein
MGKMNKKGFTMVEYILVIALSGIIFLALSQVVIITIRSFDIVLSGSAIIGQTDTSYQRMMREIRQTRDRTSLVTAGSGDIRFADINGNDIEYRLLSGQILRNSAVAIDNATAFSIEYFDRDGNPIGTPLVAPQNTNVRNVRVTLTITRSTQSLTIRSAVKLRNLR